jgi:hypothetical protein
VGEAVKRTPLKRKTRLRPRSATKKKPARDFEYMAWVKTQPCTAHQIDGRECYGPIHAHHAGERPGIGLKAADDTCIALCQYHHACLHSRQGPFKTAHRAQMRAWQDVQIAAHRDRYARRAA